MMDELQELIETKYVYQIKLQEAQLAALHSQINPHFLYNTLDSIKAMADYHGAEEIGEMAHSLADMFRYHTKSSDEIVTLQEELAQIDAYLRIQRIRFEEKIDYQLRVEEGLYNFPLLKMTLQPLVENAVFHGIEQKRGRGTIRLSAYREDRKVTIEVADDGVGISERKLEEIRETLRQPLYQGEFKKAPSGGSIGIRNVYARYAISYGDRFEFSIDSRKGAGTTIRIRLE
ncbi:sensor histidine kinase [Paenibacillus sp. CC-CFT747]|nr:sensor histidine kinase [Paenibacillus sp. CC-CFT747]